MMDAETGVDRGTAEADRSGEEEFADRVLESLKETFWDPDVVRAWRP